MGWRTPIRAGLITITAALALGAAGLRAGETAYVNMETVFEGYYKTIRANVGFELKKKDFDGRLGVLRDELKSMVNETRKTEEESANELLSQEARDEARTKLRLKVERLRAKEEEYNQFRRSGLSDLNRARLAAEEELIKDLSEFVRNYCKAKGYRLVYDITGRSLNRMPVLLLYPEEEEVTQEILTEVNKGHDEELNQAKSELEALRKSAAASAEAPAETAPAAE